MSDREDTLNVAIAAVRAVISEQRTDSNPNHDDFCLWGAALSDMLMRLGSACRTLEGQISRYGERRLLRDDEGLDPCQRLTAMHEHLRALAIDLAQAEAQARAYHTQASHLGVEVRPNADGPP